MREFIVSTGSLTIDLKELSFFSDEATAMRVLRPYLAQALEVVKGNVRTKVPVGSTGNAGRAVFYRIFESAHGLEGHVYAPPGVKGGSYMYFIEFGRDPGKFPPWGPGTKLFDWVGWKMADTIQAMSPNSLYTEQVQASLSFLVARKIAIYGTTAQLPFARGFAESLTEAQQLIDYGIVQLFEQKGGIGVL